MKAINESASTNDRRKEQTTKQRVCSFAFLATVLAAFALSGPATAGEGVPFKGHSSGVILNLGFDPAENVVRLHLTGEGVATHLGHYKVDSMIEIHVADGTGNQRQIITAANGDMLILTGANGHAIDATHAAGTLTIVGGTGRFEGAAGSIDTIITFGIAPPTLEPNPYTNVLEGTISFKSARVTAGQ
jgi:hypothetical protein